MSLMWRAGIPDIPDIHTGLLFRTGGFLVGVTLTLSHTLQACMLSLWEKTGKDKMREIKMSSWRVTVKHDKEYCLFSTEGRRRHHFNKWVLWPRRNIPSQTSWHFIFLQVAVTQTTCDDITVPCLNGSILESDGLNYQPQQGWSATEVHFLWARPVEAAVDASAHTQS